MNEDAILVTLPEKARRHLDKYWQLAQRFFEEADFALASFFAITLMEEVGKVIVLAGRDLSGTLNQKAFYSHQKKYIFAVGLTLEVNARVTRIYGPREAEFARWFREGKLFDIRNAGLYLDAEVDGVRVPSESIRRDDALLLVCFAGEVYGEIQGGLTGTGPSEWKRIIDEVDAFRERHAFDSRST